MDIKIELLTKADIGIILEWNKNKDSDFLYTWAGKGYTFPLTKEQFLEKIIDLDKIEKNKYTTPSDYWDSMKLKHIVFKIINQLTGTMIGTVELSKIDRKNQMAYVSRFLIGEEHNRNKGYGTKALREVIQFASLKLGLTTLALRVFDFNKNAIKCYENTGFKKTRFTKKTRKTNNGFWNTFTMELSIKDIK